jgi:hypothetical protein
MNGRLLLHFAGEYILSMYEILNSQTKMDMNYIRSRTRSQKLPGLWACNVALSCWRR